MHSLNLIWLVPAKGKAELKQLFFNHRAFLLYQFYWCSFCEVRVNISVNGKNLEVKDGYNVCDLMTKLNITDDRGIALAVNEAVVPKKDWPKATLNENDEVLLITATQGG